MTSTHVLWLATMAALLIMFTAAERASAPARPLNPGDASADDELPPIEGSPRELGQVTWRRDFAQAMDDSKSTGKPVLLLFQEIPGCQTCQNFGDQPLSHPLLVEAMQTSFIPVVIYNNRPGADAAMLASFDEPSWNNPVLRFVDHLRTDLIKRQGGVYNTADVADRMCAALKAADREVPGYLRLAAMEARAANGRSATATFAMHCYWDGEARLGSIDGVISTRAGWLDGLEVVEVQYDPQSVPFRTLLESARSMQCASRVFTHEQEQLKTARSLVSDDDVRAVADGESARDAKTPDQKFALNRRPHRFLPLTEAQTTKVNAALRLGDDVATWLSPGQRALLSRVQTVLTANPDAFAALTRPQNTDKLASYTAELTRTLDALESADQRR